MGTTIDELLAESAAAWVTDGALPVEAAPSDAQIRSEDS